MSDQNATPAPESDDMMARLLRFMLDRYDTEMALQAPEPPDKLFALLHQAAAETEQFQPVVGVSLLVVAMTFANFFNPQQPRSAQTERDAMALSDLIGDTEVLKTMMAMFLHARGE